MHDLGPALQCGNLGPQTKYYYMVGKYIKERQRVKFQINHCNVMLINMRLRGSKSLLNLRTSKSHEEVMEKVRGSHLEHGYHGVTNVVKVDRALEWIVRFATDTVITVPVHTVRTVGCWMERRGPEWRRWSQGA